MTWGMQLRPAVLSLQCKRRLQMTGLLGGISSAPRWETSVLQLHCYPPTPMDPQRTVPPNPRKDGHQMTVPPNPPPPPKGDGRGPKPDLSTGTRSQPEENLSSVPLAPWTFGATPPPPPLRGLCKGGGCPQVGEGGLTGVGLWFIERLAPSRGALCAQPTQETITSLP